MDTKEAIFMKKGVGENGYAEHSYLTQKVNALTKPLLENAVRSLFSKGFHVHGVLNVADLGCAAGPNVFSVISTVKETVEMKSQELNFQTPEIQFYLNDLPGNDFNTLFRGLPYDDSCFFAGVPGSFHGRLFPCKSLHLVHSSYSVHWLSQVPKGLTSSEGLALNKGNVYITETSNSLVKEAYLTQFQEDFTMFLRVRSEEVVPNGCVVLILHGRQSPEVPSSEAFELIAGAVAALVSEGMIEEEKLDSFNVPYYTPSAEEVQDVVETEGSFGVEHIDTFAVQVEGNLGEKYAKSIRGFTESIVAQHCGEELAEKVYNRLTRLLVEDLSKQVRPPVSTVVAVLNKNS